MKHINLVPLSLGCEVISPNRQCGRQQGCQKQQHINLFPCFMPYHTNCPSGVASDSPHNNWQCACSMFRYQRLALPCTASDMGQCMGGPGADIETHCTHIGSCCEDCQRHHRSRLKFHLHHSACIALRPRVTAEHGLGPRTSRFGPEVNTAYQTSRWQTYLRNMPQAMT